MAEKKKIKGSLIAEIVLYSVFGLFALWGLVYIILGSLVDSNAVAYNSGLASANNAVGGSLGFGFLPQGLLYFGIGVLAIVITLLVAAKSSDREFEKEQRRILARQNRRKGVAQEEVIEAEVE